MCDWPWSLASADGPAQRTRRMGEPTEGVYTPAVPPSPGQPWTCPTAYPLWAWFLGLPRDQGSRRKEKHSLCPSRREACPVSVSLGGCLHSSQCARGMRLVCVTGVMCACVHAGSPALSASRVTLHPQCSPLLASSAKFTITHGHLTGQPGPCETSHDTWASVSHLQAVPASNSCPLICIV